VGRAVGRLIDALFKSTRDGLRKGEAAVGGE